EPPAKPAGKGAKPKVSFTPDQQAYLNSLLAEERRKNKAVVDRMITQLETEKTKAGTSAAGKEALEQPIDELKKHHLTAKELRKKDEKRRQDKWEKDLAAANQATELWKNRFVNTTIKREITQAAVAQKAHNPRHVVNELVPYTRLVDELDED